jgi:hypothetical protein
MVLWVRQKTIVQTWCLKSQGGNGKPDPSHRWNSLSAEAYHMPESVPSKTMDGLVELDNLQ